MLRALDAWLVEQALAKAVGDEHWTMLVGFMDPKRLNPCDRDSLNDYLFGDERGALFS